MLGSSFCLVSNDFFSALAQALELAIVIVIERVFVRKLIHLYHHLICLRQLNCCLQRGSEPRVQGQIAQSPDYQLCMVAEPTALPQ